MTAFMTKRYGKPHLRLGYTWIGTALIVGCWTCQSKKSDRIWPTIGIGESAETAFRSWVCKERHYRAIERASRMRANVHKRYLESVRDAYRVCQ